MHTGLSGTGEIQSVMSDECDKCDRAALSLCCCLTVCPPPPDTPLTVHTIPYVHTRQVIASSLVNFIMLGMVFARFSAPFKRASSVR